MTKNPSGQDWITYFWCLGVLVAIGIIAVHYFWPELWPERAPAAHHTAAPAVASCDEQVRAALQTASEVCWETIHEAAARREEPEQEYIPLGGMCAEADRWCLTHGEESLTCIDARFRCCRACQGVQRRSDIRRELH